MHELFYRYFGSRNGNGMQVLHNNAWRSRTLRSRPDPIMLAQVKAAHQLIALRVAIIFSGKHYFIWRIKNLQFANIKKKKEKKGAKCGFSIYLIFRNY